MMMLSLNGESAGGGGVTLAFISVTWAPQEGRCGMRLLAGAHDMSNG